MMSGKCGHFYEHPHQARPANIIMKSILLLQDCPESHQCKAARVHVTFGQSIQLSQNLWLLSFFGTMISRLAQGLIDGCTMPC